MYETAERVLVTKYTFPAFFAKGNAALIHSATPPFDGIATPSSVTINPRGTAKRTATTAEVCWGIEVLSMGL
jgi:hypothetical protein